jgi:hypothetical protein
VTAQPGEPERPGSRAPAPDTAGAHPVVSTPPADLEADSRPNGARDFIGDLFSRELFRYLGPGFIVTIGFIDPGNWATNIAGGSEFGYTLLWVVSLSTLMLIFLQHLSAKPGIVTGHSLAANIRMKLPRPVVWLAGVTIVLACMATDLAEYLGRLSASTSSSACLSGWERR